MNNSFIALQILNMVLTWTYSKSSRFLGCSLSTCILWCLCFQSFGSLKSLNIFQSHDQEKCRTYEQRVREIERASFTPLVFSALGGMSKPTEITYKRIASLLATKQSQKYNVVISFIHCTLSFSLLNSAIMCLCGSCSTAGQPLRDLTDFSPVRESSLCLTNLIICFIILLLHISVLCIYA